MKKLITSSILGLSILGGATFAEAKSANAETKSTGKTIAEINNSAEQPGRWRWNRRPRVVTRTRIVRVGFRTYRETIQTRYFANGRSTTRVISRVRIR